MKKKLLALVSALALIVSLAGCVISTPDTVGKIGDFEVSSGLYLLAQFGAYQNAAQYADADADQDSSDVKSFLKATITIDADAGETSVVSDYVASETLKTLQTFAAVETRFKELGGELTDEQLATADSEAQALMDQYGDVYTANGIGLETLKLYERIQLEHTALLELVYGKNGETPVTDAELSDYLSTSMYDLAYVTIPLYNTSTYAFADDDQKAEMLNTVQSAVDAYNAAIPETASEQQSAFAAALEGVLPDVYAVLDAESPAQVSLQTELLTDSDMEYAFTEDGSISAVHELTFGEAAAIQYSGYALLAAVRLDPLAVNTLDDVRDTVLSNMKGDELDDTLAQQGAAMDNQLDSSAMKKLPAAKIVTSVASES